MQFIAVDVGNSAVKYAVADSATASTWLAQGKIGKGQELRFSIANGPALWMVASVNRSREAELAQWVRRHRPHDVFRSLDFSDVPMEIDVEQPGRVGRDRLASAVAVSAMIGDDQNAVIVDAGTAVTVDALRAGGRFAGGMIAPGPQSALFQLSATTDALPDLTHRILDYPDKVIGPSTESAICSGVFFQTLGGIREMVARTIEQLSGPCQVFLTGGAIEKFVAHFPDDWTYIEDLTLLGIREIAARLHDS